MHYIFDLEAQIERESSGKHVLKRKRTAYVVYVQCLHNAHFLYMSMCVRVCACASSERL
jgi:hypothetical protein